MKKRGSRSKSKSSQSSSNGKKFKTIWKNLLFFLLISALFTGFYFYSEDAFYSNLFLLLSMIFGAVTLAFLVALIIALFVKAIKK